MPNAVQLFTERARAVSPAFTLTAADAAKVAAICSRLDCLPLALELAAARTVVLPLAALLARLDHTLPLLTLGARDRPDRQRTMRATIAWSYALLGPLEQVVFSRISVFAGGFALDAAEGICARLPPDLRLPSSHAMIDVIQSLVEHNLLRRLDDPDASEPRFHILKTVQEFGREQLAASGYEHQVQAAHAAFMLNLAEAVYTRLFISGYAQVAARLDRDQENVRVALRWAESVGETELGLRLARAMAHFWTVRGYYREGLEWLQRLLASGNLAPTPARLRALIAAGFLARGVDDIATATALLTEALAAATLADDAEAVAMAQHALGQVAIYQGDVAQAAIWTTAAWTYFLARDEGSDSNPHLLSLLHTSLGQVALARGDYAVADLHLTDALRQQRALAFTWAVGDTLRSIGDLRRDQADAAAARAAYREAILLAQDHGDVRFLAEAVAGIASVEAAAGAWQRAARLFGAAAVVRQRLGTPIEGWERPAYARRVAQVRDALTPAIFAAAWEEGAALSQAALIADVLDDPAPSGPPATAAPAPPTAPPAGLTEREQSVLRLLARGGSNREIGAALFISPRTVGFHVANILAKLGVSSRTGAAAYAHQHGLIDEWPPPPSSNEQGLR